MPVLLVLFAVVDMMKIVDYFDVGVIDNMRLYTYKKRPQIRFAGPLTLRPARKKIN